MTLEDLVRISSKLLASGGSLTISMIYERHNEYLALLKKYSFAQTALKKIYGKNRDVPIVFLSAGKLGGEDGSVRKTSLYMIDRNGKETQSYKAIRDMQW
jgi:tRNA1(Val) A37 N6-methylase TrmN6